MGLHLLFHIFELLILPSAFMLFGGHLAEEPATATSGQTSDITTASEYTATHSLPTPCISSGNLHTATSSPWTCEHTEFRLQTAERTE